MKNTINYYYDIIVNDYKKKNNIFTFYVDDDKFEFVEFYGDINKLQEIYYVLKLYKINCDEIIYNKENQMITIYDKKMYLLLKKYRDNGSLNIDKIINYNILVNNRNNLKWKKLWKENLDYFDAELAQLDQKKITLKQSYSYYSSLSEISISLLNYVNDNDFDLFISHKRLSKIDDLYNPLNIMIDSRIRDIAEYVKDIFFFKEKDVSFINYLIDEKILTREEIILLLSRLIYPTYYFDKLEIALREEEKNNEIIKIIKKTTKYEAFLKKIYKNIKKEYNIPSIDFLEN